MSNNPLVNCHISMNPEANLMDNKHVTEISLNLRRLKTRKTVKKNNVLLL
jgi:hypothetical protein